MRTIILNPRGIGRINDGAAFVIAEDLAFNVKKIFANGQYHAKTKLNGVTRDYVVGDTLTIPKADLSAGDLHISIVYTPTRGEQLTYTVEPLRLTELKADFAAETVVKSLESKIKELGQVIADYERSLMAQITALGEEFTKLLNERDAVIMEKLTDAMKLAIKAADENAAAVDEKLQEAVKWMLAGKKKKKK